MDFNPDPEFTKNNNDNDNFDAQVIRGYDSSSSSDDDSPVLSLDFNFPLQPNPPPNPPQNPPPQVLENNPPSPPLRSLSQVIEDTRFDFDFNSNNSSSNQPPQVLEDHPFNFEIENKPFQIGNLSPRTMEKLEKKVEKDKDKYKNAFEDWDKPSVEKPFAPLPPSPPPFITGSSASNDFGFDFNNLHQNETSQPFSQGLNTNPWNDLIQIQNQLGSVSSSSSSSSYESPIFRPLPFHRLGSSYNSGSLDNDSSYDQDLQRAIDESMKTKEYEDLKRNENFMKEDNKIEKGKEKEKEEIINPEIFIYKKPYETEFSKKYNISFITNMLEILKESSFDEVLAFFLEQFGKHKVEFVPLFIDGVFDFLVSYRTKFVDDLPIFVKLLLKLSMLINKKIILPNMEQLKKIYKDLNEDLSIIKGNISFLFRIILYECQKIENGILKLTKDPENRPKKFIYYFFITESYNQHAIIKSRFSKILNNLVDNKNSLNIELVYTIILKFFDKYIIELKDELVPILKKLLAINLSSNDENVKIMLKCGESLKKLLFLIKSKEEKRKIEKITLLDQVKFYKKEMLKKMLEDEKEKTICRVCFETPKQIAFIPCGHCYYCEKCFKESIKDKYGPKYCPLCKQVIKDTLKIYFY